ncbi:MAG: glycosyltransferase family 39 protein [bacterium]|nr:glycosyltransferase family 39 protein [bacterium]
MSIQGNKSFKLKTSLFFLTATVYLLFAKGLPWIEADVQLEISRNLVQHHSLSLANQIGDTLQVQGKNGEWYDWHGVTNILLMVSTAMCEPIVNKVIHKDRDVKQVMSFLGALTGVVVNALVCVVFFSMLCSLGRPLKISFYTTLYLAFFTIIFPYSATNYEGNLNMLFIVSSLYFLFEFLRKQRIGYLIFCGIFAGLTINTRDLSYIFLFFMFIFIFWTALREKNSRIIVAFVIGAIPLFFLWGWYNWLRTGGFFISPSAKVMLHNESYHISSVMLGLQKVVFNENKNIFLYSPILAVSIFGWYQFFRDKRKECILILSIVVFYLLGSTLVWWDFFSWGPRYTLEITPLLILPLAYWLKPNFSPIKRFCFYSISAYSLLIQFSGTLVNWHGRIRYFWDRDMEYIFYYKYPQLWDAVKILVINLWNLFLGTFHTFENAKYTPPAISNESLYASNTVFTWWNRLMFMGVNPVWVVVYWMVSLLVIYYSVRYILGFAKKGEIG